MTVVWRSAPRDAGEPRLWPVYGAIAFALVLALAGSVFALQMFRDADRLRAADARTLPRVGDAVPTSFGVVAVEYTNTVAAPHAHGAAGVTGGLAKIGARQVPFEVKVALSNLTDHVVSYSAAQFALRARGRKRELHAEHATSAAGTLQPHASVDALLTFVAPAGPSVYLVFHDRASARPVLVDLGPAAAALTVATTSHQHG